MNKPLIAIIQHPALGPAVSGRELYPLITASRAARSVFTDWFRDNARRLSLTEGTDFVVTKVTLPGHRVKHIEFIVSVAAAIKVAAARVAGRGSLVCNYLSAGDWKQQPAETAHKAPNVSQEATNYKNGTQLHLPTDSPANQTETTQAPAPTDESPAAQLLRFAQELVNNEAEKAGATDKPGRLAELERRLATAEGKVDKLLQMFQQFGQVIGGCGLIDAGVVVSVDAIASAIARHPSTVAPAPEPYQLTTRQRIDRLVRSYASAKEINPAQVWNRLYGQLAIQFRFDAYAVGFGQKDPNYLEITEKNGQIENLYAVAQEVLTPAAEPARS